VRKESSLKVVIRRSISVNIAQKIYDGKRDTLKDETEVTVFRDAAEKRIFADIRSTVEQLGIHFDYIRERTGASTTKGVLTKW
jgi:hypothetical protein